MDLDYLDVEAIDGMSDQELDDYIQAAPYREVSGIERFLYAATHPQYLYFQLRAWMSFLLFMLAATLLTSYWNARAARGASHKRATPSGS